MRPLCPALLALFFCLGHTGCDGMEPAPEPDAAVPIAPVFWFGGLICAPEAQCDGPCCPAIFDWLRCNLDCLDEAVREQDEDAARACVVMCVDALGDSACGPLLETIADCSLCTGDDCDAEACCATVSEAF